MWKLSADEVDFKICITERLTGSYVAGDWEYITNAKNYIDGQVSDLDGAINNLDTTITNAFSDSKITNIEANSLKISFDSLVKEATDVRNIATGLALSSHASYIACGTAITNLQTEINKWVGKTSYPLTITTTDRTNITNKFQALEGVIANLYDAIDTKRQSNTVAYVDGEIFRVRWCNYSLKQI